MELCQPLQKQGAIFYSISITKKKNTPFFNSCPESTFIGPKQAFFRFPPDFFVEIDQYLFDVFQCPETTDESKPWVLDDYPLGIRDEGMVGLEEVQTIEYLNFYNQSDLW